MAIQNSVVYVLRSFRLSLEVYYAQTNPELFDQRLVLGSSSDKGDQEHVLRLAICVLLKMTRMGGEVWPEQRKAVDDAVRGR